MKLSPPLQKAKLIKRYKRFLADIELPDGQVITIHCPNTGSMKNCCEPGSQVWYSESNNPKRKYPNTWEIVSVAKKYRAGINTGRANALVKEAIENGIVTELADYQSLRTEVKYGNNSRIDILLQDAEGRDCYIEVKNVTLWIGDGLGVFPDAVTQRGAKHLQEMMEMVQQGHRAILFYCVQHTGIERVAPADDIDPAYGKLLREAVANGVEVMAYTGSLTARKIELTRSVEVQL